MLSPLLMLLLAPPPALAGQLIPLHEGPIVGDGTSEVTLLIYAPGVAVEDRLKITLPEGAQYIYAQALPWDRIELIFVPPAIRQPQDMSIEVRVRGALDTEESLTVPLVPPVEGALALSMDPPRIAAGGDAVTVRVRLNGSAHLEPGDRPVALAASVGALGEPTFDGTDWVARYTPPARLDDPAAALITAVDLTAPERVVGAATLPISIRRSRGFLEDAGSTNVLEAGGAEYGPVTAGADGKFAVELEVWPALSALSLSTTAAGASRSRELPFESGASGQLGFAPLPEGARLPAGERVAWLYASAPDGAGLADASPSVEGPGRVRTEDAGGGWYRVRFQPEAGAPWTLSASLDGASASLSGVGVSPLPQVSLRSPTALLSGDEEGLTLRARAKDDQGTTLPGLGLRLAVASDLDDDDEPLVQSDEDVEDKGDGTYKRPFQIAADTDAALFYAGLSDPDRTSTLPPARLRIWPARSELPADGGDLGRVWVIAEDAYGLPVPGVEIGLAVPFGDASLPPTISTGEDGMGLATYTAGITPGPVILRARAGALQVGGLIWQGVPQPEVAPGSPEVVEATERWRAATPSLWLGRTPLPEFAPTRPGDVSILDVAAAAAVDAATESLPSDALSLAELRLAFVDMGYSYSSLPQDPEELTPETAAFDRPFPTGIIGGGAELELWPRRWFVGAELRARSGGYSLTAGDQTFSDRLTSWMFGGRARVPIPTLDFLRPELSLGYQSSDAMMFIYTDDTRTSTELGNASFGGIRAGLGLTADLGPAELGLEAASTFGAGRWWELSIGGEYEVWSGLSAGLRFDTEGRRVDLDINGVDAQIDDTQLGGRITVGYRL